MRWCEPRKRKRMHHLGNRSAPLSAAAPRLDCKAQTRRTQRGNGLGTLGGLHVRIEQGTEIGLDTSAVYRKRCDPSTKIQCYLFSRACADVFPASNPWTT